MGEDKVATFDGNVAGKTVLHCHVVGLAVVKLREPPAAGRGVPFGVLEHKLNIRRGPGHERLGTTKGFVVFLRRDVTPRKSGDDRAVREREFSVPIGLDRYVVAQNGPQIVEVALFVGHGDQPPVAVSWGDFAPED